MINNIKINMQWHKQKLSNVSVDGKLIWQNESTKYYGTFAELNLIASLSNLVCSTPKPISFSNIYDYLEIILTDKMTDKRNEILDAVRLELTKIKIERNNERISYEIPMG